VADNLVGLVSLPGDEHHIARQRRRDRPADRRFTVGEPLASVVRVPVEVDLALVTKVSVPTADGTVAPELPGALELIRSLTLQGLIVAIGHTSCTAQDVTRAVDAGARLSVHLGNGAPAVLARHPNHLWEQLADDRLAASFIADGHHLPAATLTAMLRAKGVERSILVSDSTAFTGMPPGEYEAHIGGRVALTGDRRLSMAGTPYLAGSAVGLVDCVAGAVRHGGVSLGQAVQMASANPNGLLGRAGGAVRVGAPADVTVLAYDADRTRLEVVRVLLAGCVVGGGEG
jgi:N-acetylglucosamine-6-phosphate deacetylase